jgi:sugar lactone lactonase YvrE
MRTALAVTALLVLVAPSAMAQRAGAATEARRLNAAAGRLMAAGDTGAAADTLAAAARAWPLQPAYALAAARLAALVGRTDTALALLARATRTGYAWNPTHRAFAAMEGNGRFRTLAEQSQALQEPVIRSSVFRTLPDSALHPEGVAFDPQSGRVFVSGVRQRKVVVIERDGRVRDFVPTAAGLDAVFGMAVDTTRQRLWLASGQVAEQEGAPRRREGASELVGVDLGTGAIRERWEIPDSTVPHMLGDVVLAPDGSVYATDSRTPGIYRLRAGEGAELERTPYRHSDWMSLQGMAFAPDGRSAWVADWTVGLYHVDLERNVITPVTSDESAFTLGVDGLYLAGDRQLIALQNGIAPARVVRFDLHESGTHIVRSAVLDRHLPVAIEPTLGVVVDGALLYVANSPWGLYGQGGVPDPARPWPRPVLLRLPLASDG